MQRNVSELADRKRMTDHSKDLIWRTCWPSFSVIAFDIFSINASISLPGQNLIYSLPKAGVIGDLMTEIPLHKHCLICGNAVRPDENFCDELCESKFKSAQRKQQLLFVAFIVIMGLVLFLPSILKMKG